MRGDRAAQQPRGLARASRRGRRAGPWRARRARKGLCRKRRVVLDPGTPEEPDPVAAVGPQLPSLPLCTQTVASLGTEAGAVTLQLHVAGLRRARASHVPRRRCSRWRRRRDRRAGRRRGRAAGVGIGGDRHARSAHRRRRPQVRRCRAGSAAAGRRRFHRSSRERTGCSRRASARLRRCPASRAHCSSQKLQKKLAAASASKPCVSPRIVSTE